MLFHVMNNKLLMRWVISILCIGGMLIVFIFQRTDVTSVVNAEMSPISRFILNRTIRFLLNDAFAIGLIYGVFYERKYVIFSLYVQLAGVLLFLLPYFVIKIYHPSYNGPMINYLHRLIMNPTLLLLLLPAFYY